MAWLTLDDHDNDPAIFLSYLAAAFDRIEPIDGSIQSAIVAPRRRILSTAVPRLAFELHRWGRPALIVLDDVHRLVDRTCLEALAELLDHLPPGLRVALAGRTEPGLPFGRIRARGDLLEIGTSLLALDETETDALAAATGHRLTPNGVRDVVARTELGGRGLPGGPGPGAGRAGRRIVGRPLGPGALHRRLLQIGAPPDLAGR